MGGIADRKDDRLGGHGRLPTCVTRHGGWPERIDRKPANRLVQFRFGQHSSGNVGVNPTNVHSIAKTWSGLKAKVGGANGGVAALALAYDSWEEF
jgi:hypothetical protein